MSARFKSPWLLSLALAAAFPAAEPCASAAPLGLIEPSPLFPDLPSAQMLMPKSRFALSSAHEMQMAEIAPPSAATPVVSNSAEPASDVPLPPDDEAAPPLAAASKLTLAIDAALAALVSQKVDRSPVGAGDWGAAREAIRAFYAARGFAPIWIGQDGLTPAAASALSRLARADEDGLDLSAFALPKRSLADATPERLAEAETVISAAVVAYAMQASGARIVPRRISPAITAQPSVADPGRALATVAAADDPGAALEDFNPTQKGYLDLRGQLSRLRAAAPIAAPPIPAGPTLGIGMVDPRVPLVRARLGLGSSAGEKESLVYDAGLATAVAAFQRANGIAANGALTPATLAALSSDTLARRKAAILANMEMWRWEPRAMGEERIEINIPDYSLKVMDGETLLLQERTIVGKPDSPTPIFSNEVRYLLVNPIWRVPDSIVKKEMAPKLAQDPDYLMERGFEVSRAGDRLVVRQPPGETNALGRILFMFPNEHAVYLHDTPARALFAVSRRALSHGCVRVEQPMRLAELVMGGASAGWTIQRLQSLLGARERWVLLPHAIPIHLEYFTEFVDGSGALQDREDIYGIARRVAGIFSLTSQD